MQPQGRLCLGNRMWFGMRQAQQRHPSSIGGWIRSSPELSPCCLLCLLRSICHQVLLWPPSVTQSVPSPAWGHAPSCTRPPQRMLSCFGGVSPEGRKRLC